MKAFRALGRFQAGRPFRPWLLRIVANEARNHRRSAGRRGALAVRAAHEIPWRGTTPSPEDDLLAAEILPSDVAFAPDGALVFS